MKITNTRSEDLVERTNNNGLTEDDKNILIDFFNPRNISITSSPAAVKKQSEWRRHKYRTDEEYR